MNTVETIITAVFASTGFWTIVNTLIQNLSSKRNAQKKMLIGLGHDRLYALCNQYIQQGWVSADDYENLCYIAEPYLALGGNGSGKRLFDAVSKLPVH